jgi:hypothetical protein
MKEEYKLESLTNYKSSFSLMKWIVVIVVVVIGAMFSIAHYMGIKEIAKAKNEVWVRDTNGMQFKATAKEYTLEDYKLDVKNHTKIFVSFWYSFDEETYNENIESGVYLLGDCSKPMVAFYQSKKMADKLKVDNLRFKAKMTSCEVKIVNNITYGKAIIEQSISRGVNEKTREFEATFIILTDGVNKSNNNPFGMKIEDWKTNNL